MCEERIPNNEEVRNDFEFTPASWNTYLAQKQPWTTNANENNLKALFSEPLILGYAHNVGSNIQSPFNFSPIQSGKSFLVPALITEKPSTRAFEEYKMNQPVPKKYYYQPSEPFGQLIREN